MKVFPQIFSWLCCPTQILPPFPNPQLILLKAASEESKTVNTPHSPRQQRTDASAISHSREEEWSDEKHREKGFDF